MLALAATLGPAPVNAPFPAIELGHGNIVIGESLHDGRLPALWFGKGGLGMGVEKVMDRYAQDGETLAVVSFENVQGLDVLTEVLQRIRRTSFPDATPAYDAAGERRKGRAEALQLLMDLDPEGGIDDYIGWSSSGAPEDEGSAFWDADKLRELLDVDTDLPDMLDAAEAQRYHQTSLREEAERISAAAAQVHADLRDQVGQAIAREIAHRPAADFSAPDEVKRLADAAMLVLLMNAPRAQAAPASPSSDYSGCCDTPHLCNAVRRCTAKDGAPASPASAPGVPSIAQPTAQMEEYDDKWTEQEQQEFAAFLARFPNESSRGIISLGAAWKHGRLVERAALAARTGTYGNKFNESEK